MDASTIIGRYIAAAKRQPRCVVFAEGDDTRIQQAARRLVDEGIARVVLLRDTREDAASAEASAIPMDGITVIDIACSDRAEHYAELFAAAREGFSIGMARRAMRKPLYFAAMMLHAGDVDAMVAGAANPTRRVIEAASLCVGFAADIASASSFFLMCVPGRAKPLVFADCAVNVDPDPVTLAHIALASAASAAKLLEEAPRVAMLSFSSKGSASHPHVSKVTQALRIARELAPELMLDGELQADTALVPAVAERKMADPGSVAGQANVLIFPDLDAGNIAYKLTQYLAGAEAIGPVLQGFARPVADLSRGASVDDVVATTVITLALG